MLGLRARLVVMLASSMLLAFALLLVGVNASLRAETAQLARAQALAGSDALESALASRTETIRSSVLQASGQARLIDALQARDGKALRDLARDLALSAGLSFAIVSDGDGNVLASSRPLAGGVSLGDATLGAVAEGTLVSGLVRIPAAEAARLGRPAGATALAIVTGSPVTVGGRTLGAVLGGEFVDPNLKLIADAARLSGGATGVVVDGRTVATSLTGPDGFERLGLSIPDYASVQARVPFVGLQSVGGTEYYAMMKPLADASGNVAGATWFGTPFSKFGDVVTHTLLIILLWGAAGVAISVALAVFVAERLGRNIVERSRQVNESAKELSVLVVGSEVSGDHVVQTREKLETIERLAGRLSSESESSNDVASLRRLSSEAVGDVIVIDTLAAELASRMRHAATRVEELSEVASALNALVAGARANQN